MPAQAGIQPSRDEQLDSRFHGNDRKAMPDFLV